MAMSDVRVLVVASRAVERAGLKAMVMSTRGLRCLGTVAKVDRGNEDFLRLSPHVCVLAGWATPDRAAAVARETAALFPSARVLVVSDRDQVRRVDIARAVAAGVTGYLARDAEATTIKRAIFDVARGRAVTPPRADPASSELTEREEQVLALTAVGFSAPQIAERLHIGTTTVKRHLQRVYLKLGVSDRAAAVTEAMRRGLVD